MQFIVLLQPPATFAIFAALAIGGGGLIGEQIEHVCTRIKLNDFVVF